MNDAQVKEMLFADAARTEAALEKIYAKNQVADRLMQAMRYSLFSGGKKIRPALVLETCRMFGGTEEAALPFACAVEMIHTYSLIHDDLPCMDNDDLRRGRPTNHKVYGDAIALLAGDALLTDAFRVIAENPALPPEFVSEAARVLSSAAGSAGMVSGQVMDMIGETERLSLEELTELHRRKTGALIRASVQLGTLAAGIHTTDERAVRVTEYAEKIGLVFQIVDDVLDVTSNPDVLGKTVGKDAAEGKTTYLTYFTPERAMAYAAELTDEAIRLIEGFPGSQPLASLAAYLLTRTN